MDEPTRMDLRGATGVQIGDHPQMHLHVRNTPPSWWIRSGYIDQVRDIAPGGGAPGALKDRGAELEELAAFCAGDQEYLWWKAQPWAGKSALLSTFVLNPPPSVEVVSFFVTMRVAAQSDSVAFTDMLIDQLAAILGEPAPGPLSPGRADALRRALLLQTSGKLHAEGRRLVLVVDGIDEDRSVRPRSGLASVASLLPKSCGDGLRVVVSSRPDPPLPADVAADHPLRRGIRIRSLTMSSHAGEVARHAGRELYDLLHDDGLGRQVLALITACGGGLTLAELEELTGEPPFRLEGLLGGVFGRTVAGREPGRRYVFTHETLRSTAVRSFGATLAAYRERLHRWADDYRDRSWPPETPRYLLLDYPALLAELSDVGRLVDLALDHARHDRMLLRTGGDAAAFAELHACQNILLTRRELTEADLGCLLRLSHHCDELETRNRNIPVRLPAVWATLGYADRAEALAYSIADRYERTAALVALSEALATAGETVRVERIIRDIIDPYEGSRALLGVATVAGRAGDTERAMAAAGSARELITTIDSSYEREMALTGLVEVLTITGAVGQAEAIARSLTDAHHRARALTAVAKANDTDGALRIINDITLTDQRASALIDLADLAEPGRVDGLVDIAEQAAACVDDPYRRALLLAGLARVSAKAGKRRRALRLLAVAEQTGRPLVIAFERTLVLTRLAEAMTAAGEDEWADRLVRDITDPYEQVTALSQLVSTSAASLHRAERVALGIADAGLRAQAMTDLAAAAAAAGHHKHSADLALTAEQIARAITDTSGQAGAQADLAIALAVAAEVEWAEETARGIDDRDERERALAGVAEAVAAAGDVPQAQRIIDLITDPDWQAGALAGLAEAQGAIGDVDGAERIAREIDDPEWRAQALAGVHGAPQTLVNPTNDPDERAQALTAELATAGDLTQAERVARSITDPGRQARALLVVAAAAERGEAGRLIGSAMGMASWRYAVRALAAVYPHVVIEAAPTLEDNAPGHQVRRTS